MIDLSQFEQAQTLRVAGLTISLTGVVAGVAIFIVACVLARILGRMLCRARERSPQKSTAALYLLEKLVTYGLVIVGAVAGLSAAGLNLSSLAVFAGAVGIGVGLGLQGVVKEFVSGKVKGLARAAASTASRTLARSAP